MLNSSTLPSGPSVDAVVSIYTKEITDPDLFEGLNAGEYDQFGSRNEVNVAGENPRSGKNFPVLAEICSTAL
ncbi:MAG: hypothetical protein QNK37_15280 [Acidobacteriota bacterium]|nr:hypothetical protein [Acidobacteriota bacterium]